MKDLAQDQKYLSIHEAADILRVSTKTLRRWEERGILVPQRTAGGHRRYVASDITSYKKSKSPKRATLAYKAPVVTIENSNNESVISEQPSFTPSTDTHIEFPQFSPQALEDRIVEDQAKLPKKISFRLPSFSIDYSKFAKATRVLGIILIASSLSLLSINSILPRLRDTKLEVPKIAVNFSIPKIDVKGKISNLLGLFKRGDEEIVQALLPQKEKGQVLADTTSVGDIKFNVKVESNFSEDVTIEQNLSVNGTSIDTTSTDFDLLNSATTLSIGGTTGTTTINNDLSIAGNTLLSAADLVIDPGGGGVSIGTGTAGTIDLAGDDLFVTGDLEIDGSLVVGSDSVTDLTGTGIQVSSGSLQATLGTSISSGEIDSDAVTSAKIADDTIVEADLKASNTATNGYALTYNSSTGAFTWTDVVGASAAWTDGGTNVTLSTTTDSVTIGGSTELAKLAIDGDTDEIQFLIQGVSSQSTNLFVAENSSGTDLFTIGSSGIATITPSANSDALTITGTSVTSESLISLDSRNTSGTIFSLAYGSSTTLSSSLTGTLIDFNSGNLTATDQDVTGANIKLPTVTDTHTSGSKSLTGLLVNFGAGAGINQTGAGGTLNYIAGDFRMPALTQTAGTLNAYGVEVTTPSGITTAGTAYGLYINATGVGAGTLNGINIGTITGGSGTEDAISVASGWDSVLKVGSTTIINGSGVTQEAGGGTGESTYTTGDILYASATNNLSKLAIGASDGYVLQVSSGVPVWGTVTGSSCSNCLIGNPTSDQNISPTGADTTGLSVRQTSTASPTDDIFRVTNSDGTTKYFYVDSSGNVSTGAISNTTLTLTPTSNATALTLVGTNVTTATNQYINTRNVSGSLVDISYGGTATLTSAGTLIAADIDLSTNVTATNANVYGGTTVLPGPTNTHTSGTRNLTGLSISAGGGINQNGAGGTTVFTGADITIPALTQTAGTLTAYGANVTLPSSITTGGTAYGYSVSATGISVGTITGVNIDTISSPGAGTEYGLVIGSGWDRNLYLNDTTTSVLVADGATITLTDGTNTLCTFTDSGTTGDLSCTGSITGGSSGTQGFWSRATTTLSPATANDIVAVSSNTTSAAVLALTSSGATTSAATLSLTNTSGTQTNGILIDRNGASGTTTNAINITNTDGTLTTGLNMSSGTLTTGIDLSGASTTTDLILDDGLTISQTSDNDLDIVENSLTLNLDFGETTASTVTYSSASALDFAVTGDEGFTFTSSETAGTTTTSAFVFDATAITTGTGMYVTSDSITQGKLVDISTTGVTQTTGTLLNVSSIGSAFAATADSGNGLLANFDWNPASSGTTGTGDLFRIRLDANGTLTSGSIFNIVDESTSLFKVSETTITSALPHEFTAAGDLSVAYDLQFTNQSVSYIKSNAPLLVEAGESFESNNLTLRTFNSGNIILDTGATAGKVSIGANITPVGLLHVSNTGTGLIGKSLAIFDQDENQAILTASQSGTARFTVAHTGTQDISFSTGATTGDLIDIDWAAATTQTAALTGIDLDFSNLTSVAASTTYGIHVNDLSAQTSSTEYAFFQEGTNWDYGVYAEDSVQFEGSVSVGTQVAFADADTTPDVSASSHFNTGSSTATITDFDAGSGTLSTGQVIFIECTSAATFDFDAGNLNLGAADIVCAAGDTITFVYDGTDWNLISWMDDSDTQTGADLAELYVSSENLSAGEVVSIDPAQIVAVKKALSEDGSKVIGIVSTQPGLVLKEAGFSELSTFPIALSGRVPVKIATSSANILPGDLIGASSEAGKAEKVNNGYIIGRALEAWTPEAAFDSITIFVNPIYVGGADIAQGQNFEASGSATFSSDYLHLANLDVAQKANINELITTDLSVLGDTLLSDTLINGKLSVGNLIFDNSDSSINAVGVLRIQPLALDDIEFLGGLISFDKDGNIVAKEITADKYNVAGASAGSSTISSGQNSAFVDTDLVTENSLVFVTSKTKISYPLSIAEKQSGVGFKVELPITATSDIEFDWFIVDKK